MIVVVDYGMGNVGSLVNMFKKIGVPAVLSDKPEVIASAKALVLPGVGSFDRGMQNLSERGLTDVLAEQVVGRGKPLLGICLGMQLFTEASEEGSTAGLGWIPGQTRRLRPEGEGLKVTVPHMGWNTVEIARDHPVLSDLGESRFYFVHSYYIETPDSALPLGYTTHGDRFVSAVARDNIVGVQFHPEKSHRFGMTLLRNFATWA